MSEIKRLIAQERRAAAGYTLRLLFSFRATRAERARWVALRAYHDAQIQKWRAKL